MLDQATSWVIGPGLGRDDFIKKNFFNIASQFKDKLVTMDADALWLLQELDKSSKNLSDLIGEIDKENTIILTPNEIELARLLQRFINKEIKPEDVSATSKALYTIGQSDTIKIWTREEALKHCSQLDIFYQLINSLNNTNLVVKGQVDIIITPDKVAIVKLEGSLKRCGGQGDILTGFISVFGEWDRKLQQPKKKDEKQSDESKDKSKDESEKESKGTEKQPVDLHRSLIFASLLNRLCARQAYEKYFLSLTTSKIVEELPIAYAALADLNLLGRESL